jgi:glyoxylase-like metal-dependent hydrolase (beta-lactamase superfamily II)
MCWDVEGNPVPDEKLLREAICEEQFLILHTPGHSPGSITLMFRPKCQQDGVLFTGDTYAWTTRDGGRMSGFPRYGNNLNEQAMTLQRLGSVAAEWNLIAPGHGHPRFYGEMNNDRKLIELQGAIDELRKFT